MIANAIRIGTAPLYVASFALRVYFDSRRQTSKAASIPAEFPRSSVVRATRPLLLPRGRAPTLHKGDRRGLRSMKFGDIGATDDAERESRRKIVAEHHVQLVKCRRLGHIGG